jgi:prepilin-type N-terminal cleavage/methylation domain-containing protein
MGAVTRRRTVMNVRMRRRNQAGFTLIETMIATLVLSIGLLGLAGILAQGLAYMDVSQYEYIAQQKASEAIESIFTARDQGQLTWSTICNASSSVCTGGIFLTGALPLCDPNTDGILGTQDDYVSGACPDAAHTDSVLLPNATTGTFATPARIPLTNFGFTRTITISAVTGVSNLRTIQVTIAYRVGRWPSMSYTLTSAISNFS